MEQGNSKEAREHFQKAVEISPDVAFRLIQVSVNVLDELDELTYSLVLDLEVERGKSGVYYISL